MKKFLIILILIVATFIIGCTQTPTGATPVKGSSENVTSQTPSDNISANTPTLNTPSDNLSTNVSIASTNISIVSNPTQSGTVKEIDITAYSFGFRQTGPQINKGDKVKIVFSVEDGRHSFTLSGYNIEFTPMMAGQTQSATFIADKSGTFEYHCNNPCGPGHADMVGQLVVN